MGETAPPSTGSEMGKKRGRRGRRGRRGTGGGIGVNKIVPVL